MTYTIYLSLGSNQGNKTSNLRVAIKKMRKYINIISISSFYETEPIGENATDNFINLVLEATTKLIPQQLLREIHKVEATIGRKRQKELHWGDRIIDIDIIHYKGIIMNDYNVTLPHKELYNRIFVVKPLLEIKPRMKLYDNDLKDILEKLQEKNKDYYIKHLDDENE